MLVGTRQYVADVAKGVKDVAGVVGAVSEEVEEKVRPSPREGSAEGLNTSGLESGPGLGERMHADPSSRMKEIKVEYPSPKVDFIERIERVCISPYLPSWENYILSDRKIWAGVGVIWI